MNPSLSSGLDKLARLVHCQSSKFAKEDMNETILREVATQIAKEQFVQLWPTYALMIAVALVVGGGAAYFGAYFKRRGESFATKADFDGLLTQLKETTAVAEEVKARFSHADWATRELKTLRRLKLEELLQAVYEIQVWQDVEKDARIYSSGKDSGVSPLPRLELLVCLYFPEIAPSVGAYIQTHRKIAMEILQSQLKLVAAAGDLSAPSEILQRFADNWKPLYLSQLKEISTIELQCQSIMVLLLGGQSDRQLK